MIASYPKSFHRLSLAIMLSVTPVLSFAQDNITGVAAPVPAPSPALPVAPVAAPVGPQVAAPIAAPVSPNAVNALQQNIGQQTQPTAPEEVSEARRAINLTQSAPESTLLREVSRYQAQLSLMNILSQIQKTELEMETSRLKFEEEKNKQSTANAPLPIGGPIAPGAPMSAPQGGVAMSVPVIEEPQALVRSIYSFDNKSMAEVMIGTSRVVVSQGSTLSNGARVVSISPTAVKVVRRGRQSTLPMEGSTPSIAPLAGSGTPPLP